MAPMLNLPQDAVDVLTVGTESGHVGLLLVAGLQGFDGIAYHLAGPFVVVVASRVAAIIAHGVTECDGAEDLEGWCERATAHVAEILCHRTIILGVAIAQLPLCGAIKELFEGYFRAVNGKLDVAVIDQDDGYGDRAGVRHVVACGRHGPCRLTLDTLKVQRCAAAAVLKHGHRYWIVTGGTCRLGIIGLGRGCLLG